MIQLFIYSESHDFNTTLVFHDIFKGFFFFFWMYGLSSSPEGLLDWNACQDKMFKQMIRQMIK